MNNIKKFYKEHKNEIILTGCLVGSIAYGIIAHKQMAKQAKELAKYVGSNVIHWKPNGNFIDLKRVKEVLDLNVNNSEMFAIVREGDVGKDIYSLVVFGTDVITDTI